MKSTKPLSAKEQKARDKNRSAVLKAILPLAAFDGWNASSLREAVKHAKLPKGSEKDLFPGGALDILEFWSAQAAENIDAHFAKKDLSKMRIRDKVTEGVWAYLEGLGNNEDAARRAVSRLALPDAIGHGPKQVWNVADKIWRAIGDTSTDINFYSKRTILSGVISSTLLSWIADHEPDKAASRKFLDARISNVMSIEKAKFQFRKRTENMPSPASVLGRMRYGSRRHRRRG